MDPRKLWHELRRRQVVKLAVIYVIVGWVVIEVAATVFPALTIPDWGVSLVVGIVLLGFPVALVLSWMFDADDQGVQRTRDAALQPMREAVGGGERNSRHEGPSSVAGTANKGDTHQEATRVPALSAPPPRSIAVLPFINMSADEDNEFFSDGITEEILNALTRVRELRIASRTSSFAFKGKELDIREIAGKLNVAHILEGSVRKARKHLRITAQLINAQDGYHLWSETFDRELEDVFRIQDEIARSIVDALKVELDVDESQSLVSGTTKDMEAYTLYLRGRHVYNKFRRPDLLKSLSYYEKALEKDSDYARAYAGIADSFMSLADDWLSHEEAYPRAEEAAKKAIELDDTLAEAHTALGKVHGWHWWNFDRSELHLRRAVSNNPSYAEGHFALGSVLPANGRLKEGLTEMREAVILDPLSCDYLGWVARFLIYLRRFEEALETGDEAIELDHTYYYGHIRRGQALLCLGRPEEALRAFRSEPGPTGVISLRAYEVLALAALGEWKEAEGVIRELTAPAAGHVRAEFLAAAYGAIGDIDWAFETLRRAYDERAGGLIYLHIDPMYESLKGDPRYEAMVADIGLRRG